MTEPLITSPETLAAEATTTFNDLGLQTLLLTAIHALGYQQPTPIQLVAIPAILQGRDVVAGAEKIMVSLLNENEIEATLVGKDPDTDLAILKVYTQGYSVAALGDSSQIQIGQFIIAIGNPHG